MTMIPPADSTTPQPLGQEPPKKTKGGVQKVLNAIKGKFGIGSGQVKVPKNKIPKTSGKENCSIFPAVAQEHKITDQKCLGIVQNIIGFLKGRGKEMTETVGIFRVAADQNRAQALTAALTNDPTAALDNHDIHEVCDALKKSLRKLAFDPAVRTALIEIGQTDPIDLKKVKSLPLTDAQKEILDQVVQYFAEVSAQSATNKMDAHNLAIILAPLFSPEEQMAALHYLNYIPDVTRLFEALIGSYAKGEPCSFK